MCSGSSPPSARRRDCSRSDFARAALRSHSRPCRSDIAGLESLSMPSGTAARSRMPAALPLRIRNPSMLTFALATSSTGPLGQRARIDLGVGLRCDQTHALSVDNGRQGRRQGDLRRTIGDRAAALRGCSDEQRFTQRSCATVAPLVTAMAAAVIGLARRNLTRLIPEADADKDAEEHEHDDGQHRTTINGHDRLRPHAAERTRRAMSVRPHAARTACPLVRTMPVTRPMSSNDSGRGSVRTCGNNQVLKGAGIHASQCAQFQAALFEQLEIGASMPGAEHRRVALVRDARRRRLQQHHAYPAARGAPSSVARRRAATAGSRMCCSTVTPMTRSNCSPASSCARSCTRKRQRSLTPLRFGATPRFVDHRGTQVHARDLRAALREHAAPASHATADVQHARARR